MDGGQSLPTPPVDQVEVDRRLAFADGILGAAGHQVTDPAVLSIHRRLAAEEISGDEAASLVRAHVLGAAALSPETAPGSSPTS